MANHRRPFNPYGRGKRSWTEQRSSEVRHNPLIPKFSALTRTILHQLDAALPDAEGDEDTQRAEYLQLVRECVSFIMVPSRNPEASGDFYPGSLDELQQRFAADKLDKAVETKVAANPGLADYDRIYRPIVVAYVQDAIEEFIKLQQSQGLPGSERGR